MPSTLRFLAQHLLRRDTPVLVRETVYHLAGEPRPATLYHTAEARGLPTWILLHGITYTGRHHAELVRLARALAGAGFAVLVPDIPEWRALRVAPRITPQVLVACLDALEGAPESDPDRVAAVGFSFGATLGMLATRDAALRPRLSGFAAWGGYEDLGAEIRFLFTGRHELDGQTHHLEPDPYGRWVMGANYLTATAGYEAYGAVATALHALAEEAGRRGTFAGDPSFDPMKRELRDGLPQAQREVYDAFAHPVGVAPPAEARLLELADAVADCVSRREPLLGAGAALEEVDIPLVLAHGREDRLVPFTQLERLKRRLPDASLRAAVVTGLYSHSGEGRISSLAGRVVEPLRYVKLLRRLFALP